MNAQRAHVPMWTAAMILTVAGCADMSALQAGSGDAGESPPSSDAGVSTPSDANGGPTGPDGSLATSDAARPSDGSAADTGQPSMAGIGSSGLPVDDNGFTVFTPSPGSGSCSDGSYTGSCVTYVSNSGGSDGNDGSMNTPVKTLAKGLSLLRNGHPDWLLLKKGDVWTGESFDYLSVSGASASAPLLISSYGTGARPLVKVNASGDALAIGSCCGGSGGNFLAINGIEFYAYTRDPASPDYSASLGDVQGAFFMRSIDWMLIEDCKFSFFSTNIIIEIPSGQGNVFIRRNVIVDAYSNDAHAQGLYIDSIKHEVLEDNFLDHNGWNATLMTPVSATVAQGSPGAVTWSTTPMFPDGATLYANQSGGGLTAGTAYYVVNLSGNTFNLSLAQGGSPIAISSGAASPQKFQWGDPAATIFNRNLYNNYTNGPITFTGNISMNSSSEGAQFRSGGTITDNLFVMDSEGFTLGMDPGTDGPDIVSPVITTAIATNNVVLESTDIQTAPTIQPRADGIGVYNATGSGLQITHNIVADVAGSVVNRAGINPDNYTSGATVTDNIICAWNNPIMDQGTNDVTSPNVTNASSCSGLGFPNPSVSVESYDATLGGPGTLADFVAKARLQSKDNWNPALMGHTVNTYIRAGFGQ